MLRKHKHAKAKKSMEELMAFRHVIDDTSVNNPLVQYLRDVPYNVTPKKLYTAKDLFDVFDPDDASSFDRCYDTRVYRHEVETGKLTPIPYEMAARSFHDFGIRVAMSRFLSQYEQRQVVGIMGGHSLKRTSISYRKAVDVSKRLTELGYLMISGGGPGAMEAAHLGAWMAGRTTEEVDEAIAILSAAPTFESEGWLASAFKVLSRFPLESEYKSLSIPTWYYGHEPPSVFATHCAKLFENSIREDTLLTEAYGGLIYMEGSAGTLQEIFQEAVQNHYVSLGYASPMIFVGSKFWCEEVPVIPFMNHMMDNGRYKNLIVSVVDEPEEIVKAVTDFSDSPCQQLQKE